MVRMEIILKQRDGNFIMFKYKIGVKPGEIMEKESLKIPQEIIDKWQSVVDIMAELMGVSDALITRINLPYIEVIQASQNKENPFSRGDRVKLAGHYCEIVFQSNKSLMISDALSDQRWREYPEVEEGLISYLGFPLEWPDGSIFGTLCVHDTKERLYDKKTQELMKQFRELVEAHLQIIYQNEQLQKKIEEKENIKDKMERNYRKFRSIYENIEQGICLHEVIYEENFPVDYRILEANPAYEKITGIPLEKTMGAHATELYGTDAPPYIQIYEKVARTGKAISFEDYFKPMSKHFHITATCPQKGRFITLFQDITEQKIMEEQLRDNQEKLSITLHSIGDGVIATDLEGRVVMINPMAEKLCGWSFEEAEGKLLSQIFRIENTRTGKAVEDPVLQVLKSGKIVDMANDTTLVSRDGTKYQIADSASPIMKDGEITGVVLVFSDVTEQYRNQERLRRSREQYRQLAESANAILWEYDILNDSWDYLAPQVERILGYRSEEWTNLQFWTERLHPEDRKRAKDYFLRCAGKGEDLQEDHKFEYRFLKKDGGFVWLRDQVSVEKSEGRAVKLRGLMIDITGRKEREEKIRYMSFHDSLTGLYNRAFLEKEIKELDKEENLPISMVMADLNGLKLINDTYGHNKGDQVLLKTAEVFRDVLRKGDIVARYGGDEFVIILPETAEEEVQKIVKGIKENSADVLADENGKERIPITISPGYAIKNKVSEDIYLMLKLAEDRMYKDKLLESRSAKSHIVKTLVSTLQEKSQETEEHARRMKRLALATGERIGLSHSEMDRLSLLATLHDIGKTVVSKKILTKPGKLTPEEWEEVKQHPAAGYRICSATEEFSHIALEVLSHHERWDGKGYPRGIRGEEIPLLARLISIVDAYDVMTNGRPYKSAMSKKEAVEELENCAGTQFDPELVKVFIEKIK